MLPFVFLNHSQSVCVTVTTAVKYSDFEAVATAAPQKPDALIAEFPKKVWEFGKDFGIEGARRQRSWARNDGLVVSVLINNFLASPRWCEKVKLSVR
jgi:hypothetical protein